MCVINIHPSSYSKYWESKDDNDCKVPLKQRALAVGPLDCVRGRGRSSSAVWCLRQNNAEDILKLNEITHGKTNILTFIASIYQVIIIKLESLDE